MHRSSVGRSGRRLGAFALFLALLSAEPLLAQGTNQRFHVSTTSDVQVGPVTLDDATIIAASGGVPAKVHFGLGHWQATAGLQPGDVDGFARRPGATPGSAASIAFTLLSNEGGFLDGDVLGLAPNGGWELVVGEDQLLQGLGVPGGNIDVDAIDFDDQGRLVFSLQNDLAGTLLGDLEDGDVLRREANGSVTLVMSEPEIQARFSAATGLSSSIGDVQGIENWGSELLVVTQGPSTHDGGVLSCASVPYVFTEEANMGLGGAELDALTEARPGDELPCFTMTPDAAAPGDTVHIEVSGRSNSVYLVLMSGGVGTYDFTRHPGFGAWYFDLMDPWLLSVIQGPGTPRIQLDGQGTFSVDWTVPGAMVYGPGFASELGWSFQIMELSTFELSAPFRVTRL